jgi:16S rRNA (adenine1518-N6/adenine1519-N6)-dimethyltransferase
MKPRAKDELQRLDVRPSKRRGQNFTIDSSVIDAIVGFAGPIDASATLIEIGPGLGALTERLLCLGRELSVIEIEPAFAQDLKRRFPQLNVFEGDARSYDLSTLGEHLIVFGNLPYVFSTEIIFHLLKHRAVCSEAILLLQREFVERLAAPPGGRDYGSISVALQQWCDVTIGPVVPGTAFHPPTKVESAVVRLRFRSNPRAEVTDPVWFERVVRAAFHQRRKTLLNSLGSLGNRDRAMISAALTSSGIDPMRRAETLSIEEFARLAEALR